METDQRAPISIIAWFAYISTLVSTLALSAISLAKNVSFPKQEVKRITRPGERRIERTGQPAAGDDAHP